MRIQQSKFRSLLLIAFGIGIISTASFCGIEGCRGLLGGVVIADYDQCVDGGFPVVASNPPRCIVDDETVFVRAPEFIKVSSPRPGDMIRDNVQIAGRAKALNNTVHYRIEGDGGIVSSGNIKSDSSEHGRWVDFSKTASFQNAQDSDELIVEVFSKTPEGIEIDNVSVNIRTTGSASNDESSSESTSSMTDEEHAQDLRSSLLKVGDLPPSVVLDVPFAAQAPFADWSPPFDEACEEASAIMVAHYLENDDLSKQAATNAIVEMTNWQADRGYAVDISIGQLADIVRSYYEYRPVTFDNDDVTIDSIKTLISKGHPVIIPAAGQELGNPYFRGAGPPYHMLVVTGYDGENFIVNDPGTRMGEDYKYEQQSLYDAIHDWNGAKDTVEQAPKAMMIFLPSQQPYPVNS